MALETAWNEEAKQEPEASGVSLSLFNHSVPDAFELWCWRRLLRVPWIARKSKQSILKVISPGCSLEGLMLKLKLQYFGHLMRRVDSFKKTLMLRGIGVEGEGDDRGWDGWMASPTWWTRVWVNSGSWWCAGRPGMLQSMESLELDTTEWLHFHFSLSCIGEGNGNPLQCSCLENPRDGGAWWAAVSGVARSRTRLEWLSSMAGFIGSKEEPTFTT